MKEIKTQDFFIDKSSLFRREIHRNGNRLITEIFNEQILSFQIDFGSHSEHLANIFNVIFMSLAIQSPRRLYFVALNYDKQEEAFQRRDLGNFVIILIVLN